MYPLNDNDLDRLSRDAADQYDVDQSTSGWEALENRLNKELPLKEEKERRRFLFWLFLIVLFAGAGLLWMMTNNLDRSTLQVAGNANALPSHNDAKNTTPAASQTSPNVGTSSSTVTTVPSAGKTDEAATVAGGTEQSQERSIPTGKEQAETKAITPSTNKSLQPDETKTYGNNIVVAKKNRKARRGKNTEKAPSQTNDDLDGVTGNVNDPEKLKPASGNKKKTPVRDIEDDRLLKASIVSGVDMDLKRGTIMAPPLPIATDKPAEAPEKKEQKNKGFEIGLVAGPDMSNVKFTDMDKVGYNAGIQIGYRFSDRWSVNTGLLYTRKNYTAQGKDFTKSNSSWWQNRKLHTVQGYCAMFDIPINVRYDFSVNKKQRWFASAGASSYIMTNEDYTYNYSYTGSSAIRQSHWESDSTSTYLFSILNLSAGFERALNKRFSIQAEPYFKFPLKGLGYGKLDLNSYGIYFSLKYKLGK